MINENQVTLKLLRTKDYTSKYLLWMNQWPGLAVMEQNS